MGQVATRGDLTRSPRRRVVAHRSRCVLSPRRERADAVAHRPESAPRAFAVHAHLRRSDTRTCPRTSFCSSATTDSSPTPPGKSSRKATRSASTSTTSEEREIADGFVPKTLDWRADVDWADVVVFDDVLGHGTLGARAAAEAASCVVGGTPYGDRLEDDRAFGQQELKNAGVSIIAQENFTSFDEAIAYVASNPNRYVIKPSGEAQNYKRLLFVGEEEDGRDIIQVLEDYKRAWSSRIKQFQLQRRIMGVEVATGAFFNGKEFVYSDVRELRAQEALPRRHRPLDRRDGHGDVLERAQQDLQRHAQEDGAAAAPRRATSATSTSTAS